MSETAYYRRAFEDARFRHEQLDELRSFKKVEIGMLVAAGVAFILHTLYFGLREQKWDGGWGWLFILLFSAVNYVACVTRLGALEAIEEKMEVNSKSTGSAQPSNSRVSSIDANATS